MNEQEATRLITGLYDTWYPTLVRYASDALGHLNVAEDTVQETFIRLYRELRAGREIANPKGWTLTVVRRQLGEHLARGRRELAAGLDVEDRRTPLTDDCAGLERDVDYDTVTKLFSVLSPREVEVLHLRMAALKYEEIAKELGISASSVNTLLARALRKLQRAVTQKPGGARGTRNAERTIPKPLQ